MDEHAQQVEKVVEAALELPPAERAAYLDSTLRDDPALRRLADSLLSAYTKADRFLEVPAVGAFAELSERPTALGRRIGPYELLREVGKGGMGSVYLAARADEAYQKQVAIKLIRGGAASDELVRRFHDERQILARLDHPNIAQLHDGGTTEDGFPYLVMEYVEGTAIDEYCDRHRLPLAERLELFRTVCRAVQFAHQNLVIHRDLKPKNILVTADGVPKLLDFGIAKLLDPELSGDATRTGLRPMTPNYASPEQFLGEVVTTASDVYSLGVLLYKLLTGRLPHQLDSLQSREVERFLGREPVEPSLAAEAPRLRGLLAGDLDNIVMMALRRDPRRRYGSAEQLAEDLRRHVEGRPVVARRATLAYRAGKFLRRNRLAVGASAALFALVLAFAVNSAQQAGEIARERDRARIESEKARLENEKAQQLSAFLVEMLQGSDPWETNRKDLSVREVLDQGAVDIREQLHDQPEVRAMLLDTMGSIYFNLGLFDQAGPLLKEALRSRRENLGDEHPEVAVSLTHLGSLSTDLGRYEEAKALLRQAVDIRRRNLGEESPELAESLYYLGQVLILEGEYAEAERIHRQALDIRRQAHGDESYEVASSRNQLAIVLMEMGDFESAEPLFLEALATLRGLFGAEHLKVAKSLSYLASLRRKKGELESAAETLRQVLAIRRPLLDSRHPLIGETRNNLSGVLFDLGRYDEAEALSREALESALAVLGEEHRDTAVCLNNLAKVLYRKGAYEEAEPLMRRSLEIVRKVLPPGHPGVAHILQHLGGLRLALGDPEEAEPLLRQALELRRKGLPPGHPLTAESETVLGGFLAARGRYAEAESLLVAGHAALTAGLGDDHPKTQASVRGLVRLYDAWDKPERAAGLRGRLAAAPPP